MPVQNIRTKRPKPGTRRRWKHADTKRAEMIRQLGDKCVLCGSTSSLQFDHITGERDWVPRDVHSTKRLRLIRQEIEEGKIQLLCLRCNSSKSDSPEEDESF